MVNILKMNELTEDEMTRYNRQMMLQNWETKGQLKLKNSKVAVIGAGGLGSPVSLYLAAAGIGSITIIDNDVLELSNLNRQVIYSTEDINKSKALSAKTNLEKLNPAINIVGLNVTIDNGNVDELLKGMDIIVDCLDNFETRYLINSFCERNKVPLVHGAIHAMEGRVLFIDPKNKDSPCLSCFYPENPPKMGKFPVLGSTVGITGAIQATEVIKYLTGIGTNLIGKFLIIDTKMMEFRHITIRNNPKCKVCGSEK